MELMRMLHIHSGNLFGGVETLLLSLAQLRHLCAGLESEFALCFDGPIAHRLTETGVRVVSLGGARTRNPYSISKARTQLAAVLKGKRFDAAICHSDWSQALFGAVVKGARIPLVRWVHDTIDGRHWLQRWANFVRPDHAICNSRYTERGFRKFYRDVPTSVLYCPLARCPHNPEGVRNSLRTQLDVPSDATVIIQVGRFEECKGHILHLEALRILKDNPRWICWVVGGPQRPREEKYLQRVQKECERLEVSNRVRFLGQRTDVWALLLAADVLCQPNVEAETFGIALIEGLYAGLAVVASAIGGAQEIVNNTCGITVPARDPGALASALSMLINDAELRRTLGSRGPDRATVLCEPTAQLKNLAQIASCLTAPGRRDMRSCA